MTEKYAIDFLVNAQEEMEDRKTKYDSKGGERSMRATVEAFNTVTGRNLTEREGWLFMALLKIVRSMQNGYHEDSHVDLVAYAALYGEAANLADEHGI